MPAKRINGDEHRKVGERPWEHSSLRFVSPQAIASGYSPRYSGREANTNVAARTELIVEMRATFQLSRSQSDPMFDELKVAKT